MSLLGVFLFRVFPHPHSPEYVSLRIQSESGKMLTRKIPNMAIIVVITIIITASITISIFSFLMLLTISVIVSIFVIYTIVHIKYFWILIIWYSFWNEFCSKVATKTLILCQWCHFGVFNGSLQQYFLFKFISLAIFFWSGIFIFCSCRLGLLLFLNVALFCRELLVLLTVKSNCYNIHWKRRL